MLSASAIDRVIIEDYTPDFGTNFSSCQPVVLSSANPVACPINSDATNVLVTGLFNYMCRWDSRLSEINMMQSFLYGMQDRKRIECSRSYLACNTGNE
jgi:hypothetical protein